MGFIRGYNLPGVNNIGIILDFCDNDDGSGG